MINKFLTQYIVYLHSLITALMVLVFGKGLSNLREDVPTKKDYRKMEVDALPIFENPQKLDYKELLQNYLTEHGKALKPVKAREGSKATPTNLICPVCNSPHSYIYDNNGGRGQYLCKICKNTFKPNNYRLSVKIKCPHCNKALVVMKERKDFTVHKCKNNKCSFYLSNLAKMSPDEKAQFEDDPQSFKVRYIYREFKFNFVPLSKDSPVTSKHSLPKTMASSYTIGLILTYYVNYGLSLRKTAGIMNDIHGIKVSHQTIKNYADAVSTVVKPLVDNYPYELSDSFCGDETYIRVNGKWHYICFFFDATKKIILSYRVSPNRDTPLAIRAINDVLVKLKEIPKSLNFVVDGNPIYLLAKLFFAQHGINFDVTQVIGLTNEDPVSKEYRPLKQIIERLNRTFKHSYRTTNGFNSFNGSISFVTLFCTYFNFLRPHSSLEGKAPIIIPEFETLKDMPSRWCKLIELSQNYCIEAQKATA